MATVLTLLFLGIATIGYLEGLYFITAIGVFIAIISSIVWLKKSQLSYRFLYPGMLCFLIFTILPIFFSILISFTNLGTGHFFNKEQALSLLTKSKYLPNDAVSYSYKIFKSTDRYYIQASKKDTPELFATFSLEQENPVIFSTLKPTDEILSSLGPKEVYDLSAQLRALTFQTPDQDDLYYHRTDILLEKKPLYDYDKSKDALYNKKTGEWFVNNEKQGFYRNPETKEKLLPGYYTVIGLKNYTDVFANENFKKTFLKVSLWTFLWATISVILTFSLGMSLAIFLNDKKLKGKAIYRNLLILPYSIPFFISVLVFKGMLSKDFGIINEVLKSLTLSPIPWLEDSLWAKVSCLMVNLWLGFPYMFLVTTGILQAIPESVYEAAKIDGANRWQRFRSITLPMVLSSITPLLIGSFAFNLGNFVGIYLLTGGGPSMIGATTPAGETDILISYTYRLAFEGAGGQLFGMASSIALFIFVIITGLTVLNFKLFNVNKKESAS